MIRYDEHAEFEMARRRIAPEWAEETIRSPDATETKGGRQSYLKCFPGRHIMLRVVTPLHDPEFVVTAYFDRRRPCG